MIRRAIIGLGLLGFALCAIIGVETAHEKLRTPDPALSRLSLASVTAATRSDDAKQVQAWAKPVLDRPLFEPSRRSPAEADQGVGSDASFPRLTGIVITPQHSKAIFEISGVAKPIVLTAGSRLNGILIKMIDNEGVTIVDSIGTRTLRPSFDLKSDRTHASSRATVTVDQPPMPSAPSAPPFSGIRGLSGRPLGLAVHPNPMPSSDGGSNMNTTSSPALAPTGDSP